MNRASYEFTSKTEPKIWAAVDPAFDDRHQRRDGGGVRGQPAFPAIRDFAADRSGFRHGAPRADLAAGLVFAGAAEHVAVLDFLQFVFQLPDRRGAGTGMGQFLLHDVLPNRHRRGDRRGVDYRVWIQYLPEPVLVFGIRDVLPQFPGDGVFLHPDSGEVPGADRFGVLHYYVDRGVGVDPGDDSAVAGQPGDFLRRRFDRADQKSGGVLENPAQLPAELPAVNRIFTHDKRRDFFKPRLFC